jgi:hypothetical protein
MFQTTNQDSPSGTVTVCHNGEAKLFIALLDFQRVFLQMFSSGALVVVYPLVNVYITMEDPNFYVGKSTISTGPCSRAILVYQRVLISLKK